MLDLFKFFEPKIYSVDEYCNLLSFYEHSDDKFLLTRDFNLAMGFKIRGISYSALTPDEEIARQNERITFLSSLKNDFEFNIFCKKELVIFDGEQSNITNIYAKPIVSKWENNFQAYQINYYLFASTKNKSLSGFFEKKKEAMTTETEKTNDKHDLKLKARKLLDLKGKVTSLLQEYLVAPLSAEESLDFFIEYINGKKKKYKPMDFFEDSFIGSDCEFKKDHIIHYTNDGEEIYSRFISIKSYATDEIQSDLIPEILKENMDLHIIFHLNPLPQDLALKKVRDNSIMAVNDEIKQKLKVLEDSIKTELENIFSFSLSILIRAYSKKELDEHCKDISKILETRGLITAKESINLSPLYFSFFPARGNLNARVRKQTSSIISTLLTFENDILGFKKNSFGNKPVAILKHLSGSPFLFNFHEGEGINEPGHTLVIGGTGYGKTTLMCFLMMNLMKYDINIFAMDKLNGMHNFCNYLGGEYHNIESMKFNPFSLKNDAENINFLKTFLGEIAGVEKNEFEVKKAIGDAIERLYLGINEGDIQFSDFLFSLESIEGLKMRFETFLESLFDNQEDALNFKNQLSIINMDSILKDQQLASLSAFYIFHKLKKIHKDMAKGYFIWIDELRDYLNHERMGGMILEAILEIRKLNGVITMGVQNIDFFDSFSTKSSFLDNMSNFIIFPTTSNSVLENLESKLNLTSTELRFLSTTPKNDRKVLIKTKNNGSQIVNINLARLEKYLKVFNSDSVNVKRMQMLMKENPQDWRDLYIKSENE